MTDNNNIQFYTDVINKCWEDASFKERLIANPEEVLASDFGKYRSNKNKRQFKVIDQTDPNVVYINLPKAPAVDELELTDEELENVAGGGTPLIYVTVTVAAFAIGAAFGEWNDSGDRWF